MLKKILIATDGSKHSEKAAVAGIEMAKLYGAAITVLYVVDIGKEYAPLGDLVSKAADELVYAMRSNLQNLGAQAIGRVEELAKREGLPVDKIIIEGYPAKDIIRIAEEGSMNLIVVGGIGATGIERFLLGSVADRVVRNSRVPVLVVRKE